MNSKALTLGDDNPAQRAERLHKRTNKPGRGSRSGAGVPATRSETHQETPGSTSSSPYGRLHTASSATGVYFPWPPNETVAAIRQASNAKIRPVWRRTTVCALAQGSW